MTGHDELRHLLGGYVLGGLSPEDRARLEQHLATCEECREELAGFAPLPGLLRSAPAEPVPPGPQAPPELLARLLADVRRRRRGRRLVVLAAAAVLVAFAALGTWLVGTSDDPSPTTGPDDAATLVSFEPLGDWECHAEAELVDKAWGTELVLSAESLPGHGPYWLEVTATDGTRQRAASWGATPAGRASVHGATSIPREEIASVRVVSDYGPLMDARLPG